MPLGRLEDRLQTFIVEESREHVSESMSGRRVLSRITGIKSGLQWMIRAMGWLPEY